MINTNKNIEIEGGNSDLTAVFVMYGIPPSTMGDGSSTLSNLKTTAFLTCS